MKNKLSVILSVTTWAALLFYTTFPAHAETWNLATGGSWNIATNWNPASVPNAIGANATFNNAVSGSNPAQTATRTITADGAQTVGSINFNNDGVNAFNNSITVGTSGSLIFDETGTGPVTITLNSITGSTGNNIISAPITLTDSLVATVNNINATSGSGALSLTATISGSGGFTKQGDGLATFGTGTKTYTGATVLSGGRMRISVTAAPTASSSFTINAGAQLTVITAGTIPLGAGSLNLNGAGATTGPFAIFPGAIRNNTDLANVIPNATVLQSDTILAVQGLLASLTFTKNISGPGKLTLTPSSHDANLGTLVLGANNTYQGGTVVDGGTLVVSNASGTLGTGNVTVNSANLAFGGSSAKLTIQTGVTNAIADTATLTLAGGKIAATADDGFVELQSGVNEVVAGLVLAGTTQAPGIYGSTTSTAPPVNQNDEFFAGPGIVTVAAPPPPTLTITLVAPNVILSWPTNATGFTLQNSGALSTPTTWTNIDPPYVVSGTNNTFTTNAASGNNFFRLTSVAP